jgi:pimeloyl-ACP methyl ester carboxylesterase
MKKFSEFCFKLSIIIGSLLISSVLIIKRFVYFRPKRAYLQITDSYKIVKYQGVYGWFFEGTNEKIILICGGNTGNMSYRSWKAKALNNMGYSVLLFDYSGFGQTDGIPNEEQCKHEATLMLMLLLDTYNKNQVILYGESIGGLISVYVAKRYGMPKVILESSYIGIREIISDKFPYLSFMSVFFDDFNLQSEINGYKGLIMSLHSTDDKLISYSTTGILQKQSYIHVKMTGTHEHPDIPWTEIDKFIKL